MDLLTFRRLEQEWDDLHYNVYAKARQMSQTVLCYSGFERLMLHQHQLQEQMIEALYCEVGGG